MKWRQLEPPRMIAVDVDGTMYKNGIINRRLIEWLEEQKDAGYSLMLWSMRGKQHALAAAAQCGCDDLFDIICSKPGYIVDDEGWQWIRNTHIVASL